LGDDPIELGELAFAGAMAQNIADSFFSMCRFDGEYQGDEQEVSNVLQNAVNKQITYRNYLAHGDWWIGQLNADPRHPELIRMLPKSRGEFANLSHHPPQDLDRESDTLRELLEHVSEFGPLALGLPVPVRVELGAVQMSESSEFRVGDLFTVQPGNGARQQKATVLRNGPQAARIVRVPPDLP